jgi:hypothetical protein
MKTLFVMAILALTACNTYEQNQSQTDALIYTQDYMTGLCFASRNGGEQNGVMSNVPCTDRVLQAIEIQKKRK